MGTPLCHAVAVVHLGDGPRTAEHPHAAMLQLMEHLDPARHHGIGRRAQFLYDDAVQRAEIHPLERHGPLGQVHRARCGVDRDRVRAARRE